MLTKVVKIIKYNVVNILNIFFYNSKYLYGSMHFHAYYNNAEHGNLGNVKKKVVYQE